MTRRSQHCRHATLHQRSVVSGSHSNSSVVVYFLRLGSFMGLPGPPRLSCLKIPVETIAPPFGCRGISAVLLYQIFTCLSRAFPPILSAGCDTNVPYSISAVKKFADFQKNSKKDLPKSRKCGIIIVSVCSFEETAKIHKDG